jgi:hypothetical protein
MAGQELTDPRLIAEFNDRQAAADAGLDFDKISRSQQYKDTLENNLKFGRNTGFAGIGSMDNEGSVGNSWFRGQVGQALEGAAQGITRLGNTAEKAIGLDPNQGALGGEGMFSDAAVDYNDAQARINAMRHAQGMQARGRTGPDLAAMAGSLMTPMIGGGAGKGIVGAALHAAGQGAIQAGLQPVDDTSKDDFWTQKAMQIASGAGTSAAVGTALKVPGVVAGALGSRAADVAQNVDRFDRLGLTPSLAETSPSRGTQQVSKALAGTLLGGPIAKRAAGTLSDLGGVVSDTADQIAGGQAPSRFDLGQLLKSGLENFRERFKEQSDDNYDAVKAIVPKDTMVDMNDTVNAMRGPVNQFPNAPGLGEALSSPKLAKWANILSLPDNLGSQPLSFAEAHAMRARIGDLMNAKPGEITDLPTGDLKQVYGALSESMKNALGEGTPERKAWDDAYNFYKQGRSTIDNVIQPLLNKPSGENMVDTIQNMVKQNGVGVQTVRNSLEPDDWDKVAGYMFSNLGQARPGEAGASGQAFSINKFLTDFNTLRQNPEAFNAAFGGTKYEPLAQRYQDIADIADQAKKSGEFVNRSQSANVGANLGIIGGLFTHPHIAIPTVASGYTGAGILANPTVARTVANMGRAYQAMGTTQPRTLTRYLMEQTAKLHGLGMQQIPGAAAIGVGRAIGGP